MNVGQNVKRIKLPSGRSAIIRKGKGRDLMRAHRAAAGNTEPLSLVFALIAELVEIDDKPIVYEDVLEMELDDVLALQDAILSVEGAGANFPPTPGAGGPPAATCSSPDPQF
jgi:hypothetical protein